MRVDAVLLGRPEQERLTLLPQRTGYEPLVAGSFDIGSIHIRLQRNYEVVQFLCCRCKVCVGGNHHLVHKLRVGSLEGNLSRILCLLFATALLSVLLAPCQGNHAS